MVRERGGLHRRRQGSAAWEIGQPAGIRDSLLLFLGGVGQPKSKKAGDPRRQDPAHTMTHENLSGGAALFLPALWSLLEGRKKVKNKEKAEAGSPCAPSALARVTALR